jgi:hypothetical protein
MEDERLMIEEQFSDESGKKKYKARVEFNEKNYFNEKLKKGEKKKETKIRILPINGSEEYFKDFGNFKAFFVTHIHSLKVDKEISQSGFKKFICHNDEHVNEKYPDCPLCKKSREYYDKAKKAETEPEQKALGKMGSEYKAKKTYIVRVIVRGHEDEGVKFWRFNAHSDGKGIFDQLKSLYNIRNNESIEATGEKYNIFDLKNGRDIIVTSTYNEENGRTNVTIADAGFLTPLSKDENQMMEWINDEKTWMDVYAIKSTDYMQLIADGEIPVYDKENKRWVAKSELAEKQNKKEGKTSEEAPQDDEEEPVEEPQEEISEFESNDVSDDLPF